jgi:hypothetical protein
VRLRLILTFDRPKSGGETDIQNFDMAFTKVNPALTPPEDSPAGAAAEEDTEGGQGFEDFTFVGGSNMGGADANNVF